MRVVATVRAQITMTCMQYVLTSLHRVQDIPAHAPNDFKSLEHPLQHVSRKHALRFTSPKELLVQMQMEIHVQME